MRSLTLRPQYMWRHGSIEIIRPGF